MEPLRARLPRTWGPFLGRFARPSPVQEQAIPPILDGHDVLLTAPTASGKTEAFAAPAAELAASVGRREQGLCALILSPTRALANDLFRRLETRFEDVAVTFGRYTGEHKDRTGSGGLPAVAIATPEALDSLLARREQSLRAVRLVVMDEIHILDHSVRGDHLRVLLHRLQRAAAHPPQRVAVSATVDDPAGLATRYLRSPVLIQVAGHRRILVKEFLGSGPRHLCEHVDSLLGAGLRKILVFCNSRNDVELTTRALRQHSRFRDAVFPHHGSLSQTLRERTEEHFLAAPAGVAVATMTLEIGIDIGSVDYVLLAGIPHGIAALLQRIGRGNRRSGSTRAGYVIDRAGQRILSASMFRAARDGRLLGSRYGFRPGVLCQQALVLAGALGWVDAHRLKRAVPTDVWADASPAEPGALLDALADAEHLERRPLGRFVLGDTLDQRYREGRLHSNLADDPSIKVIDRLTGDVLGAAILEADARLHLAGATRRVVRSDGDEVLTDSDAGDSVPKFLSKGIPLTSFALARDVVLGIPRIEDENSSNVVPCFRTTRCTVVLHGLGTIGSHLFGCLVADRFGRDVILGNTPFGMSLQLADFSLPTFTADTWEKLVIDQLPRLARLCSVGRWHRSLPRIVGAAAVRRLSDVDSLRGFLTAARLCPVMLDTQTAEDWADLAARW